MQERRRRWREIRHGENIDEGRRYEQGGGYNEIESDGVICTHAVYCAVRNSSAI